MVDADYCKNEKLWINQYKYGNLKLTKENKKNLYSIVKPNNRLQPLIKPYLTNVDTNMAWINES